MNARVFPRRTKATPTDDLAFVGDPPLFIQNGISRVMVSCLFTWDRQEAERLARAWARIAPVEIGGPAFESRAEEFVPGRFVADGYTITSRGCPNKCWFCAVPRREGTIRELPIYPGWNVLDSNLLACSDAHVRDVFAMLKQQRRAPEFTGGLEAARLQQWHADALRELRPKQLFFANDTPNDRDPLFEAGEMLLAAGFTRTSHALRAYVLCGFPGDTFDKAEGRMHQTIQAGFMPMAMLYRDDAGTMPGAEWRKFQRHWARPAIISAMLEVAA